MDESSGLSPQIALTGATGFIGSEFQHQLVAAGFGLRALVRPQSAARPPLRPGVARIAVALDDGPGLAAAVAGVDAVVYCAGAVRGCDFADFAPANVEGVREVCAAALNQPVPPRIVLISSLAATQPQLSDYACSKRAGEVALMSQADLAWTILRPPAVYGRGDKEMLPLFRAIRGGLALRIGPPAQRLSLLHVEDLARAVIACLRHPEACDRQIFTLDDGHSGGYDWPDIVAATRGRLPVVRLPVPTPLLLAVARVNLAVARRRHRAPMLTPGKVRELSQDSWLCDNSALTAATAWTPQILLRAGVQRLFSGD